MASHELRSELIGESAAMRDMSALIARVAPAPASVLILGESGTGKELVARALHRFGPSPQNAFVAFNCAAVPDALIESELFGHVKGAFTDARSDRPGLFRLAHRGTLLLDEIGELSPAVQAKLLRALQERTVRPVGGNSELTFDTRVIAATHRNLELEVEEGRFREDLYYRLNVVSILIPPLRLRGEDILLLAQHFVLRCANQTKKAVIGFTAAVAAKLMQYSWPGNVRELQNCCERAVILTDHEQIVLDDLPAKLRDLPPSTLAEPDEAHGELLAMEEVERRYVLRVLAATAGNKSLAGRILGFDRRTIARKLRAYGISTNEDD